MTIKLHPARRDRVGKLAAARMDGIAVDGVPAGATILRAWFRPATASTPARFVVSTIDGARPAGVYPANFNARDPGLHAMRIHALRNGLHVHALRPAGADCLYALVQAA